MDSSEDNILSRTCLTCNKVFSGKSPLNRHLREVHKDFGKRPTTDVKSRYTYKCLEGCDSSFPTILNLREHLNIRHDFNITVKVREFRRIEDFNKWFITLQENGDGFIKHNGQHKRKHNLDKQIAYYKCNRSGKQNIKTFERKRKLKKQGYRKSNAGCTSFLKLTVQNGKCVVRYCNFHYGHKIELEHLPVNYRARADIVEKLDQGAQIVKLKLDNDGNYIGLNNLPRSKILTRMDLKSLKYYAKKEMISSPSVLIRKMNVLKPDEEEVLKPDEVSTVAKNDQFEIITIISNDSNVCEDIHRKENPENESSETRLVRNRNVIKEQKNSENDNLEVISTILIDNSEAAECIPNEFPEVLNDEVICDSDDNVTEYVDVTEEDLYGRHVAAMLVKIEPSKRILARKQIDSILKRFLGKSLKPSSMTLGFS